MSEQTQTILNQIIITAPKEPPFNEFVHAENTVIIAAITQDEYDALIALKAECGDSGFSAVTQFKQKFVSSDLPALSRFRGLRVNLFPDENLAVGEGSGEFVY